MIRLINNRFFTFIETLLLVAFAVLMFTVGDKIFNVLFGIALIVYVLLFVLTKVIAYRGMIQLIAILEFFAMTTLAIFVIVDMSFLPEGNMVNLSVGLAMWFRATTEILHSYFGQGQGRAAKKQFNGWKIFAYILLVSLGTFVATNAKANDDLIRYFIAGIASAGAVIMAILTYTNFRDRREQYPKAVAVSDNEGAVPEVTESATSSQSDEILVLAEAEPIVVEVNNVSSVATKALPDTQTIIEPNGEQTTNDNGKKNKKV